MTATVENKSKYKAALITVLFHLSIFLLLYFTVIVRPNPPFPPEGDGVELGVLNYGTTLDGSGNVESNGVGVQDPNELKNATTTANNTVSAPTSDQQVITSDDPESVSIKSNPKKEVKKQITKVTEQVVEKIEQPSSELERALAKMREAKGNKGTGGDGNGTTAGNSGDPNGKPEGNGTGTSGTGPGGGEGRAKYSLKGRKLMVPPQIEDDSQESGTVIVEIIVNENGKVISATPGMRGSTTTSAILYAKARQAALGVKFNPSPDGATEQRGTFTFVFTLD